MENHNTAGNTVREAAKDATGVEEKSENPVGGNDYGGSASLAQSFASGGEEDESFRMKRKRGRPRKEPAVVEARQEFVAVQEYSATPTKRGRGRPRGSGKCQTLAASLGATVGDTAGTDFTPCVIAIQEGENIVQRIWSFSRMIPDSLCVLSASGTISSAELYVPASNGHVIRYEGQFSLIYLNGSRTYDPKTGGRMCFLSVQLANLEGRFFGGAVASSLIACGPTQLIVATFRQKLMRQLLNVKPHCIETPKLSKNMVPVLLSAPLQVGNNNQTDIEAKGIASNSTTPSDPLFNEGAVKGPNLSLASPSQLVDCKSLQLLAASRSEVVTSSCIDSGVN